MNEEIEERFRKQREGWDFTTLVGGKIHSHKAIVDSYAEEEAAALDQLNIDKEKLKVASPPIEPEEVENLLKIEYALDEQPADRHTFTGLFQFNSWYLSNKDAFSAGQQQALDQLVKAQELVGTGNCCGKKNRAKRMEAFYAELIKKNYELENDLIPSILNATGKDEVEFMYEGETIVLHKK